MLDLTGIPVVDNHCHPVLLNQHMDGVQFRGYCTEATDAIFAEEHIPNTVYYLWLLRQMAIFYGCERDEETILEVRNKLATDALIEHLFRAANIDTLVLDPAYPPNSECYTPERMGQLGRCRAVKMLRLETLMQQLILQYSDFDDVVDRFSTAVSRAREDGFCALKSIVAYRTGLNIMEWSKDEAVASFDLSYTIPFVDKLEMLAFTRQALGVAPASKLMFSTDGIHIPEMHWAGALRGRSVIGQVLDEMIEADEIDEEEAYHLAQQILHDTAYAVYKL